MQSKAAHVLRCGRVGTAAEEDGEVLDPLHVVMLGFRCQLADRHVLDHAPTQRADGLFGHRDAPVLSEAANPPISRQDAPARHGLGTVTLLSPLPRAHYSASGLVL